MSAPQAYGEFGRALLALEQRLGSRAALAAAVGVRKQAITRWAHGAVTPDVRCAEKLCELEPTLRPILESKRAFVERRKRPPLGRGAMTRQQAQERRDACMVDVTAAREEIAACELPRVPAALKHARRPLIELLAPKHTRRARLRKTLAEKRASKAAANIGYEERTGRRTGKRSIDDAHGADWAGVRRFSQRWS